MTSATCLTCPTCLSCDVLLLSVPPLEPIQRAIPFASLTPAQAADSPEWSEFWALNAA
jgi:hypothetical protein